MTTDYKTANFWCTSLNEFQDDISQWQRDTFPGVLPQAAIGRLKKELDELSNEVAEGNVRHDRIADEVADCFVVLVQVADALGVNLNRAVTRKMNINYRRDWHINADGTGQHVKAEAGHADS